MRPRNFVYVAVFFGGLTTLGVELSASRLLGNIYGTSNLVWANIIGLMLVYLTAGYFLGGWWADRHPDRYTFYRILAWGAFAAGLVPILSRPVLRQAATAVEQLNAAIMAGSFLSILILFSVPITLLGCISPFAIRLSIRDMEHAGRVSGRVYATSTIGSILGTFLPVLLLVPLIGTARTFLVFGIGLVIVALVGLWFIDRKYALRFSWMPLTLILLGWLTLSGPLKSAEGQIFETESSYNYIQVIEAGSTRALLLNEGQAVHSIFDAEQLATYGTWDYFLAAPFFNEAPVQLDDVHRIGLVGLAAGTISKQYSRVFPDLPIDGWEIDPRIVEVGREYFDMNEPNLNVFVADGRWGLNQSQELYSVIGIDAYRPPYIPWHLTTKEFFEEVHASLTDDGVLVINVGRTPQDRRLIDAMVGTMTPVFEDIHVVDVPGTFNTIVYATVQPTSPENVINNFLYHLDQNTHPFLIDVLGRTVEYRVDTPESSIVFTDDKAPVEQLVDSIVLRFLFSGEVGAVPLLSGE